MNKSQSRPDDLGVEALAAIAVLKRLGEAKRRKAIQALGYAEVRRIWTPRIAGDLPTLTRLVPERDREEIYASRTWADRYRGGTTLVVYVAQARGLARLSADLGGLSLAKVGSSTPQTLGRRIERLGTSGYGAYYRCSRRYERESDYELFTAAPRLQLARQDPLSPVRLTSLGIEVSLPSSMTPAEFEAALNRRLLPIRLQTLADSVAGRDLCLRTGVDPQQLRRFYRRGTGFRAATEFAAIRPQADIGALGRLVADIVIDAVLGLDAQRPIR